MKKIIREYYQTARSLTSGTNTGSGGSGGSSGGGGGAVSSVFGRTGAVIAVSTDYSSFYQPLENQRVSTGSRVTFQEIDVVESVDIQLGLTVGEDSEFSKDLMAQSMSSDSYRSANSETMLWKSGTDQINLGNTTFQNRYQSPEQIFMTAQTDSRVLMRSNDFTGWGFIGTGWALDNGNETIGKSHLIVDYLTVRDQLTVNEYTINEVTATNGDLWVTDAQKLTNPQQQTATEWRFNWNQEVDTNCYFQVGDLLLAQSFSSGSVISPNQIVVEVIAVNNASGYIDVAKLSGDDPWDDEIDFVRFGNTTDASRQTSIALMGSSGRISILDGVDSPILTGKEILSIGKQADGKSGLIGSLQGTEVFSIRPDLALIAGIEFDDGAIFTNDWAIASDGTVLFSRGQVADWEISEDGLIGRGIKARGNFENKWSTGAFFAVSSNNTTAPESNTRRARMWGDPSIDEVGVEVVDGTNTMIKASQDDVTVSNMNFKAGGAVCKFSGYFSWSSVSGISKVKYFGYESPIDPVTVTRNGIGNYTITHNVGHTKYSVDLLAAGTGQVATRYGVQSTNSTQVFIRSLSSNTATDAQVFFTVWVHED